MSPRDRALHPNPCFHETAGRHNLVEVIVIKGVPLLNVRGETDLSCLRPVGLPGRRKRCGFKQSRLLAEDACFK